MIELRSFLGLCKVFRWLVLAFAQRAAQLNRTHEENQKKNLDYLRMKSGVGWAVKTIQWKMVPTTFPSVPSQRWALYAIRRRVWRTSRLRASAGATRQDQKSVQCCSRSLSKEEKAHDTTRRTFFATVWSVLVLRPYLGGCRLTIRTYHGSLRLILNLTDGGRRLARWVLRLLKFDFNVVHLACVKHQSADAMSRLLTDESDTTALQDYLHVMVINVVNHKKHDCL